jgi:hypothetical protein
LISWALQIARGMEFMADKNVWETVAYLTQ